MTEALGSAAQITLGSCIRRATQALEQAGIEYAGNDARSLASAALGVSTAQILGRPERPLSAEEVSRLMQCVARRAAREPVSRIIGEREFYGRAFSVTPATLDPRPDSETVIDAALSLIGSQAPRERPVRILDVGTGSGCLLLTLLSELPRAWGVGTDISLAALEVARANAARLDVSNRASWVCADALDGIRGPFDVLVSNPPYIRTEEIAELDPEVHLFDPRLALDGGEDGLRFYRRLIADMSYAVVDGGWIVLEVGYDQADAVSTLLLGSDAGREHLRQFRDVAGRRRCVAIRARNYRYAEKGLGFSGSPR